VNAAQSTPTPDWSALVWIALGSNLGDSVQIIRQAMDRLEALSTRPLLRSSLWLTSPVDCAPGTPPFVNAVVGLSPRPGETPESLLAALQLIERQFGRPAQYRRHEPRVLDLDLLAFGAMVRSDPTLTLPHPRAHQRRFVLAPLAEIAPDLVLPGQDRTVRELLEQLASDEVVQRLDPVTPPQRP